MTRTMTTLLVLATLATAAPAGAQTFGFSGFGGKIGYAAPENLDGTPEFGVHAEFERPGSRVHLMPSVMYWNTNDVSNVNPNLDLYYHFEPQHSLSPYLGAGLGMNVLHDQSADHSDTNVGANFFGGLRMPAATSTAFLEGRFMAADRSAFALLAGMTFGSH